MKTTETAVILIVDNDPSVRKYLEHVVKDAGHTCVTAATGAQALAAWKERSFDLVVTDLNMPNGDGITLAKSLQRSEAVPIIFITGFAGDHQREISEIKGAAVLEKPFESEDLMRLIDAKLAGAPVGEDGRHAVEDGRRQWHGGIAHVFRDGAWREGHSEPLEEDGGVADEENPGLK